MSLEAMQWAFGQTVGRSSDKLILLSLSDRAGEEHLVWPSHERLARDTELNKKTIKEGLKRLREAGFIRDTGERRGLTGKVVVYQLSVGRDVNKTENGPIKSDQKRAYSEEVMGPKTESNGPKNGPLNGPKNGPQNLSLEPIKESKKYIVELEQDFADAVIAKLNLATGRSFRTSKNSKKPILARIKEKFTFEDFSLVIEHKTSQWLNDQAMSQYLRPETLFQASKFEAYLQAAKAWDFSGRPSNEPRSRNNSGSFGEKLSTVERNSRKGAELEARLMREIAELEAEEDSGGSYSVMDENGRVLRSGVG